MSVAKSRILTPRRLWIAGIVSVLAFVTWKWWGGEIGLRTELRRLWRTTPAVRVDASDDEDLEKLLRAAEGNKPIAAKGKSKRKSGAEPGRFAVKTIQSIPNNEAELATAFDQARGNACEPIPPGEPLEIANFTPFLTARDQQGAQGGRPTPSSRRNLLSVGLDVSSSYRAKLPTLSRNQILSYLRNHYLSVQVRIQRDAASSELYLYHRPLAVTALFGQRSMSQEFVESVALAARDMRGLGLFVKRNAPNTPENLRTMVLVSKTTWSTPSAVSTSELLKPRYEFVFVRSRPSPDSPFRELNLHVFATTEERQLLHYLPEYQHPLRPDDCDVKADVYFTEYSHASLNPKASATRSTRVKSQRTLNWSELDRYALAQSWGGAALDNLTEILDAIIDKQLVPQ